jgi:hypothetical protein
MDDFLRLYSFVLFIALRIALRLTLRIAEIAAGVAGGLWLYATIFSTFIEMAHAFGAGPRSRAGASATRSPMRAESKKAGRL